MGGRLKFSKKKGGMESWLNITIFVSDCHGVRVVGVNSIGLRRWG